ncbi:MAG: tripartite tricarboxylate transporter substrate binding protein [Polynucleobacter sp.]|nr:tripartite tricarboxylate transporter substrate binding protein [Polynucleobacter sp.]
MKKNYLGFSVYLAIASFLGFFASSVISQETGKQIRLIVPFAPGGSNDIVGRAVAQQLSPRLKRSVIVENKPGAGGVLGAEIAARAEPDGNTLLLISSSFAMNSSIMKLSYDPVKSFAPLAMLGMGPSVIVVNSATPVNSIKELVDFSNNNPSKTNFSTAGVGSFQHFAIELFKLKTGANFVLVHYKGGGPALVDLAAGHIQISLGSLIQMQNFMKAGQIKVLAVAGSKRVPLLPNVPTLKELGIDVEASNWWAILAPTGTSNELLDGFHKEINQVLVDPEIKRRFANEGAESLPMSRIEFEKLLSEESVKWARVAKLTGIKPE